MFLRQFQYAEDNYMLAYWTSDPKILSLYSEPICIAKEEVG